MGVWGKTSDFTAVILKETKCIEETQNMNEILPSSEIED
jgi:hypothetical protein